MFITERLIKGVADTKPGARCGYDVPCHLIRSLTFLRLCWLPVCNVLVLVEWLLVEFDYLSFET